MNQILGIIGLFVCFLFLFILSLVVFFETPIKEEKEKYKQKFLNKGFSAIRNEEFFKE